MLQPENGRKIAYVMSRFPHLPETFILREMIALEKQGWAIALYPLIAQKQSVQHEESKPWLARVQQTPFISLAVLAANGRFLLRHPFRYFSTWGKALWHNKASAKFLLRALALLPKAALAAHKMQLQNVQHIHAHYATHPALFAWIIHRLTGISYSITIHAHDIFVTTVMLKTKFRDAAFIAAISQFNRDYIANLVGEWVREKTFIVHCGLEPAQYTAAPQSWAQGEPLEIISTGSLQPYKGQQYLIAACARLRSQNIPFRCRIIGEGEERPALERLISESNLQDNVQLLGAKTQVEVARLLSSAHCYVQPSIITPSGKMEGIPVALMEAMACGVPVIASNLSGIPELVIPGKTGYLVEPEEPEALAKTITAVYHNPQQASQLGANGRAHVLAQFDLQTNAAQLSQLFQQHIQHQRQPGQVTFSRRKQPQTQ